MTPATYTETLDYVNEYRAKNGKEPLAFIPSGKANSSSSCPLARAEVAQHTAAARKFIRVFDDEARGLDEFDPWVLVEGRITVRTLEKIEDAPEGHAVLAEMNDRGDTKHVWDPKSDDDVQLARTLFGTLTKRGMRVFRVGAGGVAASRMDKFDPSAGRMIAVPQLQGG